MARMTEDEEFSDWARNVWKPAVKIIADAFQEATGSPDDAAEHFANAVLARLVNNQPPITIRAMERNEP